MKKRWLFILAVLMIAATMFVACNSEVTDARASAQPGEELVYATFGGGSKDLSVDYDFIDYTQLYWFYQAEKKDDYGRTGVVTDPSWAKVPGDANRKGLDGTVGPFSQGLWAFKLKGYEKEYDSEPSSYDISVVIDDHTYYYSGLVYSGESTGTGTDKNEVNLKYGNSNAIPVTVAPAGETGKIALGTSDAPLVYTWYQGQGGDGALKLKVTVSHPVSNSSTDSWDIYYDFDPDNRYYGYIYTDGSEPSTDLPTGNYNLEFTVCAVETVGNETVVAYEFAKQSLSLTVFGSQTTYVKGDLVEGLFVENAHFVATDVASKIVIANSESVSNFVVDPTPVGKSVSGKQTTVSIPAGELTSGTQNNMTIEVVSVDIAQEVATAVDFVIEPEETSNIAVAAIDITLKQVTTTTDSTTGDVSVEETSVKNFTQPVTITTYISPNLNGVKVRYNVQPGDLDDSQPNAGGTSEDPTVAAILESEESTGLGYHPASGLLRFQTTHFSQFFVISDAEAQNVTTGVFYSSFKEAVDKATDGQTIKLQKDISVSKNVAANAAVFEIPQNGIVIDGNGHTVSASGSGGYVFYFVEAADYKESWAIKNLTINSTGFQVAVMANAGLGSSLSIDHVNITCDGECVYSNGICYVDGKDCTFTHSGEYTPGKDAVYYSGIIVGYGGSVVLENCSVTAFGNAVCTFPSGGTVELKNCDVSASSSELENAGYVIWARNEDYTNYPEYVRDSSIIIDGGTVSGAIKVTQKYTSRNPHVESKISIKDGTITGSIADYSISGGTHIPSDDSLAKHIIITGGTFNFDPSEYVAPGYYADEISGGTKWEVKPYTEAESHVSVIKGTSIAYMPIEKFRDSVNNGVSYEGYTVTLYKDVDLNNVEWIPIGTESHPFIGTFDGAGHTVSNLKVTEHGLYSGLFGFVDGGDNHPVFGNTSGSFSERLSNVYDSANYAMKSNLMTETIIESNYGAVVKNVNIDGFTIDCATGSDIENNGRYSGSLVGYAKSAYISNCDVSNGTVTGCKVFGGVIGVIGGSAVIDCNTSSNVTVLTKGTGEGEGYNFGGIVGATSYRKDNYGYNAVINCTNNATLDHSVGTAGGYMAGIIGFGQNNSYTNPSFIFGCTNNGVFIDPIGSNVSGIASGCVNVQLIINCTNTDDFSQVTASGSSLAGIIDCAGSNNLGWTVISCSNTKPLNNTGAHTITNSILAVNPDYNYTIKNCTYHGDAVPDHIPN